MAADPRPVVELTDRINGAAALAVPIRPGDDGPVIAARADEVRALLPDADLLDVVRRNSGKGEAGEVHVLPLLGSGTPRTLYLVGIGDGSLPALRNAAAALVRRAKDEPALTSALVPDGDPAQVTAVAESTALAVYTFSQKSKPKARALQRVEIVAAESARPAVERAQVVAAAAMRCRDLVNTPSLQKTPQWLAEQAREACADGGVDVRIRDEQQLAAEGFGGILAVGMGSVRPPRLIEMSYRPAGATRHVVLVGKGITFDSGGLSIKPNDNMMSMKTDMAGGAAVIATMAALQALGVTARVTGLVPAAENMPSGSAQRPGDVITHYGGRTVEVLNTDAEGRLVLADALAYADAHLDPDVVVDLATLTGAASLGLGKRHAALFTSGEDLADELVEAGAAAGERLWPMPLVEDYRASLDSDIADLRNIADPAAHFSGGAIVAALFLREFTGGRRWAHLDIAGPARAESDEGDVTKGGTGFGVRTLLRWLAPPA
ncbi:MAG TPA: leucyl aminopeptidase [Mycobacteriales bacterium]|nr:leucyl aminopeptidase [Mycobacteriales bacterium]